MTTTLHVNLRGIFLAGDSPENPTNSTGEIFSNIISTITNFFHSLITWFNQEFPPESRDEQIRRWITGATPYLIVACVLITLLCCWCCLFSCITSILSCFFQCVFSILSILFIAVWSVFQCVYYILSSLFNAVRSVFLGLCRLGRNIFSYLFDAVRSAFRCLCRLLRRMKAPGQPGKMISRSAFEANPRAYFLDLRSKSNSFAAFDNA